MGPLVALAYHVVKHWFSVASGAAQNSKDLSGLGGIFEFNLDFCAIWLENVQRYLIEFFCQG